MNTLRLKLNPYKDINIASIEDKPLSPYSELNNYMKEPFLKWAYKFIETTERELNDDFNLIVIGEEFEVGFLNDMQKEFESCVSYEKDSFQINYTVDERYNLMIELASKYGVNFDSSNYKMPTFSEVSNKIESTFITDSQIENAALFITNNKENIGNMLGGNSIKIVVVISDITKVTCAGNMQYVWEIEESRLSEVIKSITDRFVKIPLIIDLAKQLEMKKISMEEVDAEKLVIATAIDMFVIVDDIKDIELGQTYEPTFRTVPDGEELPALRMVSSNPNIVSINGNLLSANEIGHVTIEFYKAEEIIPFARKEISTYRDNFVKKIELALTEKSIGISKKQQINIVLVPEDADDINNVKWSVDNQEIAEINNDGVIFTKKDGRVIVTAETTNVKESIEVEILPNISEIRLSETIIEFYVGQTKPINAHVEPRNAYNNTFEWKTSDKSVAVVEKLDDETEVIKATGIGECVITCVAIEGNCNASCKVLVESTFKKREYVHTMLSVTAMCMVVAMFCTAFSFKVGTVPAAIATVIFGIMAFLKNKSDRFWAILLIVISVVSVFW